MVENVCGRNLTWLMWTSLVSPSSVDTMMYSGSSGGKPVTRPGWRKLILLLQKTQTRAPMDSSDTEEGLKQKLVLVTCRLH